MADVTQLLDAAADGDPRAAAELLPLVYDELRKLAAARMAAEAPGQTLQATALVHDAYVRLVGGGQSEGWNGRGHFFAAAAEAMRRILVERARSRQSLKHGGDRTRVALEGIDVSTPEGAEHLEALDEALTQFEAVDPVKAELVKLRYFTGLSLAEAAKLLGISRTTADRYWSYARVWLYAAITDGGRPGS